MDERAEQAACKDSISIPVARIREEGGRPAAMSHGPPGPLSATGPNTSGGGVLGRRFSSERDRASREKESDRGR